MKKFITGVLALAMMFSILVFNGEGVNTAKAAGVTFTVTADPSEMLSTGGDVTFNFVITNNTGAIMLDAVITTPANYKVDVGNISVDGSAYPSYSPDNPLKTIPSSDFTFVLSYKDADGVSHTVNSNTIKVNLKQTSPILSFNRDIDKTVVTKNGQVTVTYTIQNNSEEALTITSIKDNFSSVAIASAVTLAAGSEQKVYIKTYTITKDITSAPIVTYKYLGTTYTKQLDEIAITVGSASLEVTTTSDKTTGASGETIKFITSLKNTGTENLTGLALYDSDNNVVATGVSVNSGETKTVETNMTLTTDKDIYFLAKGKDSQNNDISFKSNTISLSLNTPLTTGLEVTVTADKSTINSGDAVTFIFKIKNTSGGTLSNVTVGEQGSDEPLTEDLISSLANGATGTITATISDIYTDASFTFIAVGINASGRQVQATSIPKSIVVEGEETATPPPTSTSGFGLSNLGTLFTIFIIIIVLIVISVIILLVLVSKEKKKRKLIAAQRSKQQLQQKKPGNGNGNKPRK